jgi:adenine-specific DNA-methyltransferase
MPFKTQIADRQIATYYNKVQAEGMRKGERYGEERIFKASLDSMRGCKNQRYWIRCPDGSHTIPPGANFPDVVEEGEKIEPTAEDKVWKWTYSRYSLEFGSGNIVFKETNTSGLVDENGTQSRWNIYNKLWLSEQQEKGKLPSNFIGDMENRMSSAELEELKIPFDFAKPSKLIGHLLEIAQVSHGDVILDFFSGSATTAHAVMQLNAEDGGKRRHIMVQLPESCDAKSEAFKAGYKTIAEIGKERIRRAGKKILAEWQAKQTKEKPAQGDLLHPNNSEPITQTQAHPTSVSVC